MPWATWRPGDPRWLWTARYANRRIARTDLVPVQTSLARPKFAVDYRLEEVLPHLMPSLWMLKLDLADYAVAYRRKVDYTGLPVILDALRRISRRHAGRGLVICCFEDLRKEGSWCHRHVIRHDLEIAWGIEVPELAES